MNNVIQHKAAERGMQLLRAAGCLFAIQMPDGSMVGELSVRPPKQPRKPKMIRDYELSRKYKVVEKMKALEVGAVAVFECDNEKDASKVRDRVSSQGVHRYGKGNFMTTKTGSVVEVLRIA